MIHACDIDEEAIVLAEAVLWISSECPEQGLDLNLRIINSLGAGACQDITTWADYTGFEINEGYSAILGNPPYVRVSANSLDGFDTKRCKNMYAAFTELSINLLDRNGLFCFIVPQSIVGSKETQSLRDLLLAQDGELTFQVFDSVPDFLFDQGKIESNSNTSINQRTTIISLNKFAQKSLHTSPLLRWRRREERDILFQSLKQLQINEADLDDGKVPMLESKEDLHLYRKLRKCENKIASALNGSSEHKLFIPKAVRYFISAVPDDLERSSIVLNVSQEEYSRVHITLNSNVFYWWWRVYGNGFQVDMDTINRFPLLSVDKSVADELSEKLKFAMPECESVKFNAGKDIINFNYNFRQDIISEIDKVLLDSIKTEPHKRIFGCKTNSVRGDMSKLIGYDEPTGKLNIEVKSVTSPKENALVRLSTIKGWDEFPKPLVVFTCDNIRCPPIERQGKPNTKSRDIEVNVVDYSLHYFNEDSPSLFVPLPKGIDIDEVTSIKHKENPEIYNSINAKIKQANKQSGRPIRLILEKNGVNTRIHYQCKRNMLPSAPEHIEKKVSSKVKKILVVKLDYGKTSPVLATEMDI